MPLRARRLRRRRRGRRHRKCRGAYDDPVALNASLTSRVGANCAYPFPARVQLYRNQGAKRAWVGAGFVREQLERLVANQVNPKAFAAATDMAILKDMAAKKVLEIANRPFPPNPPPPPPPPGLPTMENAFRQEGDAEWNTAPIWAPILAAPFVSLCAALPCTTAPAATSPSSCACTSRRTRTR